MQVCGSEEEELKNDSVLGRLREGLLSGVPEKVSNRTIFPRGLRQCLDFLYLKNVFSGYIFNYSMIRSILGTA